ncbi:MAG: bifunctional DNA-formamidopyrimidine glycosylase/DNA-(apurinic or apyrimidinic site) lyase [Planctomycetota bacterium]|nr:bifunctional DNA-formamidopyrimidine glycosylase/DNA-(apurinic or apyrimidinic site) lyase [Planctomycetota bacterium]
MPELPEVETIVRQIRSGVEGREVQEVTVSWPSTVARPSLENFRRGLVGQVIERVWRRGKWFIFDLDSGSHLVGHLRMSGRLYLSPFPEHPYMRAALSLDNGQHLVFADVRKFGRLILAESLEEALPSLGPDANTDEVDGLWMEKELRKRKRFLKPLLLDQSFLAGLGNIYVDEALHRAGLHPLRKSHRVPASKARELVSAIKLVLQEAIEAEGSSFDIFYRTPEGQPGAFQDQFQVYGRSGKPCRRCGRVVVRRVVAQRGTHICHGCQPAPRPRKLIVG